MIIIKFFLKKINHYFLFMKRKSVLLCSLILLCFFCEPLFANNNSPAAANIPLNADTLPVKPPPGLFARIAEVFKFKKYARLKGKNAIMQVIQNLGIKDSISATKANVALLTTALNSIKDSSDMNYNLLLQKIDTLKLFARKNSDSIYKQLNAFAQPPTDEEIFALAEKILPIIQNKIIKSKTALSAAGRDSVNQLRSFFYYTNQKTDSAKMKITRKADIYCFTSAYMNKNYLDFNFNILNNIIYNGYDIGDKNALSVCTGNIKNNRVLKTAAANKCHIILSLTTANKATTHAFLTSDTWQQKVAEDLILLLSDGYINGVNIMLTDVDYNHSNNLISFIDLLAQKIDLLTVTLPAFDIHNGYDIDALNKLPVKQFILDFTSQKNTSTTGPVISLNGPSNSMQAAANRFLNSTVPFKKLIVAIPYYGVNFTFNEKNFTSHYHTLDEISESYTDSLYYDSLAASIYADVSDLNGAVTNEIWYDDATTLNDKYNFILQNNFGGIAIDPLKKSAAIGYANIWNGIANSFFTVTANTERPAIRYDSCLLGNNVQQDAIIRNAIKALGTGNCYGIITSEANVWQKLQRLFTNSCLCQLADTGLQTNHYFDSLLQKNLIKTDLLYYQSYFGNEALSRDSTGAVFEKNKMYLIAFRAAVKRVMLHISFLILILFIATLVYYFNNTRANGQAWKLRIKTEIASIALLNLLILSTALFFYFNDHAHTDACTRLPRFFLPAIILAGMLIGSASLYYGVFKLVKSENEP